MHKHYVSTSIELGQPRSLASYYSQIKKKELLQPLPNHDGGTYDPDRDKARLNAQQERVWAVMKDGCWRTLEDISEITGDPPASVSARLRDFRKEKFGSFDVERKYVLNGLYRYRVIV